MKRCVIMDIDGTLSDASHRVYLLGRRAGGDIEQAPDWEAFLAAAVDDVPHPEIAFLNNLLVAEVPVFIVTGRNAAQEVMTVDWLKRHEIHYDKLYMRGATDRRPDTSVKADILAEIRSAGYEPLFAVEDRKSVTAMWRANGVRCLQVCEGDY